jgi:hypothetical protein
MKKYGFFSLFILPFYSAEIYLDTALHWKGRMIKPFFLLFLLCHIPFALHLAKSITDWSSALSAAFTGAPTFSISEGRLSLKPGHGPFQRLDQKTKTLIIINPEAEPDQLEAQKRGILFGKDRLSVRNGSETHSMTYANKGTTELDETVLKATIAFVSLLFLVIGIPLLLFLLFFYHILIALSANLFAQILPEGREMDREMVFRIAVTASLPMTVVLSLLRLISMNETFLLLGAILISCFFTHFGLKQAAYKIEIPPEE